ncbi:hypothetical protein DUI87_20094 [Hirundo rustica rustica]|uniref:Uncharacterized protein n=1 Tax=Hirundo rustica rustica TaxID=333673 RepID=A0A3M0JRF8_HIRRU|nr:hypothetical protein DUI87_20094 [Hirundo rustica rustica]
MWEVHRKLFPSDALRCVQQIHFHQAANMVTNTGISEVFPQQDLEMELLHPVPAEDFRMDLDWQQPHSCSLPLWPQRAVLTGLGGGTSQMKSFAGSDFLSLPKVCIGILPQKWIFLLVCVCTLCCSGALSCDQWVGVTQSICMESYQSCPAVRNKQVNKVISETKELSELRREEKRREEKRREEREEKRREEKRREEKRREREEREREERRERERREREREKRAAHIESI